MALRTPYDPEGLGEDFVFTIARRVSVDLLRRSASRPLPPRRRRSPPGGGRPGLRRPGAEPRRARRIDALSPSIGRSGSDDRRGLIHVDLRALEHPRGTVQDRSTTNAGAGLELEERGLLSSRELTSGLCSYCSVAEATSGPASNGTSRLRRVPAEAVQLDPRPRCSGRAAPPAARRRSRSEHARCGGAGRGLENAVATAGPRGSYPLELPPASAPEAPPRSRRLLAWRRPPGLGHAVALAARCSPHALAATPARSPELDATLTSRGPTHRPGS